VIATIAPQSTGFVKDMVKILAIITVGLLLAGCSETPSETHRRIIEHEAVVNTYEELKESYSMRRRLEMDEVLSSQAQESGKSEERILEESLELFRKFADCKILRLQNEEVAGDSAVLTYQNTDTCFSEEPNVNQEIVYMVNEDGWKIDRVEINP
jgi:hypothetical protein